MGVTQAKCGLRHHSVNQDPHIVGPNRHTQQPPLRVVRQRIGQGQAALVLAYDTKSMGGMEVMSKMDNLRSEYARRIQLLKKRPRRAVFS